MPQQSTSQQLSAAAAENKAANGLIVCRSLRKLVPCTCPDPPAVGRQLSYQQQPGFPKVSATTPGTAITVEHTSNSSEPQAVFKVGPQSEPVQVTVGRQVRALLALVMSLPNVLHIIHGWPHRARALVAVCPLTARRSLQEL